MKFIIVFFLFWPFVLASQVGEERFKIHGELIPGHLIIGEAADASRVFLNGEPLLMSNEGLFVFGFDRDDTGTHMLKIAYIDGTIENISLNLQERAYDIQRINNLEQRHVSPPASELNRIAKERQIIQNARRQIDTTQTAYYTSGFVRPVEGGRITGTFGNQRILNNEPRNPHNGVDIALPTGSPVYAMADGIVALRGDDFYYNGNFVLLDHGHGLNSVYVHLHKIHVNDGDFVTKGQLIGEVGSTGRSTGPHLHWGVQWYQKRIDPMSLLNLQD